MQASGARVVVADAGDFETRPRSVQPFLSDIRRGESQDWPRLLGRAFGRGRANVSVSPKMRVHVLETELEAWRSANKLDPAGFVATGLLKTGGLSTLWGAMTPFLDAQELGRLGLPAREMTDAFAAVIDMMGVSGPKDSRFPLVHPPLPLSSNAQSLLKRNQKAGPSARLRLGLPHQAVLTQAKDQRAACNACGGCLWGCGRQSIFDASTRFAELARASAIEVLPGTVVEGLVRDADGWGVICRGGSDAEQVRAGSLILAAGHLPSTRLVLNHLSKFDQAIRMQHAPAFAFAALLPGQVGAGLPSTAFGMAQLAFEWDLPGSVPGAEPLFGAIYDAGSVAPSDLFAGTPLGINSFASVSRALMPALVLVFCYLPPTFSDNTVTLRRTSSGSALHVEGRMSADLVRTLRRAASGISGELARLGGIALPGSLQLYGPGAEVHAGAELAMAGLISQRGEVVGAPGLYVVDTAALPAITAKHPTLTAMANSYRIAHALTRDGGFLPA